MVPDCQTNPILSKDRFSYLRNSQVTNNADRVPKAPNANRCQLSGNIGVIGPERKNKTNSRAQKTTQLIIAFALELGLNLKYDFNVLDLRQLTYLISPKLLYRFMITIVHNVLGICGVAAKCFVSSKHVMLPN